jgi:hypothetical protein
MRCETCGGNGRVRSRSNYTDWLDCTDCHGTGEKEKTMMRDEALDEAFVAYNIPSEKSHAEAKVAFIASLKASGWTLARVEPTEKMLKLGAMAKALARQKFQTSEDDVRQIYADMIDEQEENDE